MRKWWKRIRLWVLVLLVLAQFVPLKRTNPPFDPAKTIYALHAVPANVQAVFQRSCKDCHSNETHWPWYSHVAPVSWVVVHDVNEARRMMNLSEWGAYPERKKRSRLEAICEQMDSGEMPDSKYTLIHRDARLTEEERKAVCAWADATRKVLAAAPAGALARPAAK